MGLIERRGKALYLDNENMALYLDHGKGFVFVQWENFTVSTRMALGDQLLQHTHHLQRWE